MFNCEGNLIDNMLCIKIVNMVRQHVVINIVDSVVIIGLCIDIVNNVMYC